MNTIDKPIDIDKLRANSIICYYDFDTQTWHAIHVFSINTNHQLVYLRDGMKNIWRETFNNVQDPDYYRESPDFPLS
jgi:hypothetical protein